MIGSIGTIIGNNIINYNIITQTSDADSLQYIKLLYLYRIGGYQQCR